MEFISEVTEDDDGFLCLEFSEGMMEVLDLSVGDVLEWKLAEDGSITFNKKKKVI